MKRLKMFLILLFISLFCFIPNSHAASINEFEILFSANIYNLEGKFSVEQQGVQHTYIYGGIPVFFGFEINNLNFSKQCNFSYTYRVDYQIWGFHNTSLDFRDYAQLIQVNNANMNTIGTIIQVIDDYHLNFSTFFTWTPTYCPVDSINSLRFDVHDFIRNPIQDNFFYNSQYSTGGTNYYIYDKLFSDIDKEVAIQLVTNYYGGGSDYKQDLENIKGQIVNVNDKLEETNQKLDNLYQNINQTNNKLDSILDNSSPDLNGLGNANTWLPQGPVDSIIMLPLNFINTLINKIGSTCSPINLPIPFLENKFLTLPCVSTLFEQINGFSTLYNLIGVIGSVYLLYNYLLKFYKWIDDTLSFRENNWQDWGGD